MTYILLSIITLLLIAVITMAVKWPKVIELSDIAPKDNSPKNNWLQLQNEGGKYVRIEKGRIKLKIVK
jgi:hypothetical protein